MPKGPEASISDFPEAEAGRSGASGASCRHCVLSSGDTKRSGIPSFQTKETNSSALSTIKGRNLMCETGAVPETGDFDEHS